MKLGEILVEQGTISEIQLRKALNAQLVYGGHLGTCLIELGYVTEAQLGKVLSDVYKVPFASVDRFRDIPLSVTQLLPVKLVEKHNAVPFERQHKKVSIAMIDPTNIHAIDEMSFAAGCKAVPWVAPEVRIAQAMEQYYGIQRRQRYILVCNELDHVRSAKKERAAAKDTQAKRNEAIGKAPSKAEPAQPPRVAVTDPPLPTIDSTAVDMCPAAARAGARAASPIDWTAAQEDTAWSPERGIADLLCAAECMEAVTEAILDYTSRSLARCMLLTVKSTTAVVRSWRGFRLDRAAASKLGFCVTEEPVFQLFVGDGYYRGPLPEGARYREIYDSLAVASPLEILMIPVYLEDRLVAVLYGDGGTDGRIEGETEDYRRLVRKLAVALNIIILKKRLRSL
jgi:hypothetical protein